MSIQHQKRMKEKQTKLQEEWCDTPERIIISIGMDSWQSGLSYAELVQLDTSQRKLQTGTTLKMANVFSPLSEGNEGRKTD
uniref:Putative ovule protein n=1 Tax=Solanum chacoense TaxID=4108 RepID=A0A0V0GXE0_SOLCH